MILRGAMTYHGYGWSGRAGTLHARRGLGLLLATPGAEPRGSSPVRSAVGGWRSSASLEPEVVSGLSLRRDAGTWYGEGSWLRGNVEDAEGDRRRRWWGTLEYGRRGRREVGLVQVFSEAGWSVGLHTGASAGSGNWSAEWAWSGRGTAQGAVWNLAEGAWRFRAGLTRVGAGYRVPSVRLYRTGSTQETVVFRLETRWQAGVGRFLRFGLEDERGVSGEAWVRTDNTIEVEAGERIRPGAQLVVLWRSRRRGDLGSLVTPGDVERTIRGELDIHRRTWRARIRLEERNSGTGRARATSVRFGRTALAAWEVRTALVVEEGRPPDIWWYGRRAGGLYGWDRLPTGTWVGAWARLPVGRWSIEVSADARGKRWDLVGAVRVPMG